MKIYDTYKNIPFPFLHNAAEVINKKYPIKNIYIDSPESGCLVLGSILTKEGVIEIFQNLIPENIYEENITLKYSFRCSYSKYKSETRIFFRGIDYSTL